MSFLSDRLVKIRKSRGFTQQQVVDRSKGLIATAQVYSNYETGNRNPDYETLCRLATIYGVTTDYLLGQTDEELPQINEVGEITGLSNHAISIFANVPDASRCVNAIVSSNELQDVSHEMFLIQNMIERINNGKKVGSTPSDIYFPDDESSVRVPSEDFFAYHSHRLGTAIATALEKWAINEYGGNSNWRNLDIESPF